MLPEVETGRFSQVIIARIVVNLSRTQSVSKAGIFSKTSFYSRSDWGPLIRIFRVLNPAVCSPDAIESCKLIKGHQRSSRLL